jgi:hypothetical protein
LQLLVSLWLLTTIKVGQIVHMINSECAYTQSLWRKKSPDVWPCMMHVNSF